jgi:signal transduction histidine kinase
MRLRVHHPLFAGFLGVIALLVALTLLLVSAGLRRELRATFQADLERQLALGAVIVESAGAAGPDSVAELLARRTGYRVTLIDTAGVVLGDSDVAPGRVGRLERHDERPEVRAVLDGDPVAFAERRSETVGLPLLYGAYLARLEGRPIVLRMAASVTQLEAAIGRVQRSVAAAGLFAVLAALAVAYLVSRLFTRPLVVLADRARRLSEGDFSGKVPPSDVSELHDLAAAFNRLSDELRSRLSELGQERDEMQALIDTMAEGVVALTDDARLLRTNRTARALLHLPDTATPSPIGALVRDPDLRQALEDSVAGRSQSREIEIGGRHLLLASRALDQGGAVTTFLDITELRRLEAVRRDFVANASHELKTPLTSIRGYAEALADDDPPDDVRRQFLAAIRVNTLRLQRLVDDLLDLSRLESGGWSAQPEPCSAAEVAHEAWDLVQPAPSARHVHFDVRGDTEVLADRQGLVQVLRNLFENAARHVNVGGHVLVTIDPPRNGRVQLRVVDDGEGIPSRALPRIFERFYRADSSRARDFGGTGLGLAIVKHLLGAMGGEVSARSELGKGTTIHISLPAA